MPLTEKPKIRKSPVFRDAGPADSQPVPKPIAVSAYLRHKHVFDRGLALVLLVPCLPLIGLLVVLVRLTSRGPGIFRQVRVGLDGREFTMCKIRSMYLDAEARSGACGPRRTTPARLPWDACSASSTSTSCPNFSMSSRARCASSAHAPNGPSSWLYSGT